MIARLSLRHGASSGAASGGDPSRRTVMESRQMRLRYREATVSPEREACRWDPSWQLASIGSSPSLLLGIDCHEPLSWYRLPGNVDLV